ncbi:MAG: right-handed parallel beta-helix repeat-containing protein [Armatimonadota bacterium]
MFCHLSPALVLALAGLLIGLTQCAAAPKPGATLYVSLQGRDNWSGKLVEPNKNKTDGPLATLPAARDAVRKLKATGLPNGGVTVIVKGGAYELPVSFELTAEDSGTATSPIVYRSAPGESVRLIGGKSLPGDAFKPVEDQAILTRLAPEVRAKVVCLDLKSTGLTEVPKYPNKYRGAPPVPELFCNDQRMTVAHWPNEGWAKVASIIQSGSIPRTGDKGKEPGIFVYTEDEPSRWKVDEGVWLQGYWCFDWFDETLRIKSIDPATKQITLSEPTLYGVKQGNPSPRRYKALNVLEELNTPGEYYIDVTNNRLYFYPPMPLKSARLALSSLNAPLLKLNEVSNVTVRGFIVEAGLGSGIEIKGGASNQVQACEVRNVRQVGINVDGGTGHRLVACDIHHTGTGGVILSGGDRKTLTPSKHEALNCHVWRYSEHQLTYANAFLTTGVGTRVANCLIHDAPHQAIGVGGNDHIFEYNVLYNICTETDDCGAYYKGRNPSCRGNIVRHNFFYNIGSPMGHGNAAVYFDDGDGGDMVFGNVFFRCGDPGKGSFGTVFSHGGHDLKAENNIFVECKRSLGSAPWNDKRWADFLKEFRPKLMEEVDITKPPYTERYPDVVGMMEPKAGATRVSRARNNVLVMGAQVSSGNWQVPEGENWITDKDPGFVNAAKGNFALSPNSEVFKKLPDFQPIPFAKIGLYKDELRPTLPVQTWTYPPPKQLEPLSKTVAAARAKKGPIPVFKISRATTPIAIDGNADGWDTATPEKVMPLAQDVMGNPAKRQSKAWLAYDDKALYVLVDNTIQPNEKLTGNQWGQDTAIEIALQPVREGKQPPIYVLRGFANGRVEFGSAPDGNHDPLTMDPGGIVYKATSPEKGRWIAEVSIPLAMLDLDPAANPRARFSLSVRKPLDDLWLMWEGARGHTYDVSQTGIIEFVK